MKKKYLKFLLLFSIVSYAQNDNLIELKKDYYLKKEKNGFSLLSDKQNSSKIIIANAAGKVVFSFKHSQDKGFLSGLNCGKFFTSKIKGSLNDGGGFTVFDYVDVEIHDLLNPDVGVKTNYSIADGAHLELFEIYKIFDNNDKVGLINACGEVIMPPRYNAIGKFNKLGQAYAYTDRNYTVIDTLGNSILKSPYQHSMKQVYKTSNRYFDEIKDNRVVSSNDGLLFGIYDFKQDKQLLPNIYDEIQRLSKPIVDIKEDQINKDLIYQVRKNNLTEILEYSNQKVIFPMQLEANGVTSFTVIKSKYFFDYYKVKKEFRQINASVSEDVSKQYHNIYYNNKVLFDPKLEIKKIDVFKNRYITLHLYNGDSMIYDLESEKFITTIKGAHAVISSYDGIIGSSGNNMQNRYNNNDKFVKISVPCVGSDCHTTDSFKSALFDLDEHVFKTSFLQDATYAIIQVDKAQQKFLYLVHHRPNAFSLAYSLFNSNGKASLENFDITTTGNDYDFVVYDNLLFLNEHMGNFVYGKTSFNIDGNLVGERFLASLKPLRNQQKSSQSDNAKVQTPVNNRFIKKQ